jgi:hypothetical protein
VRDDHAGWDIEQQHARNPKHDVRRAELAGSSAPSCRFATASASISMGRMEIQSL